MKTVLIFTLLLLVSCSDSQEDYEEVPIKPDSLDAREFCDMASSYGNTIEVGTAQRLARDFIRRKGFDKDYYQIIFTNAILSGKSAASTARFDSSLRGGYSNDSEEFFKACTARIIR